MIKFTKNFQDYQIQSDGTQYTLSKNVIERTNKKGETYEVKDTVGYYGSITSLVRGLQKDMMLSKVKDTDMTLNEALNESTRVWERIEAELKGW